MLVAMIGAGLVPDCVVMTMFTRIAVCVDMIMLMTMCVRMAMLGAIRVAVLVGMGVFMLVLMLTLSHGDLTSHAIGPRCIKRKRGRTDRSEMSRETPGFYG